MPRSRPQSDQSQVPAGAPDWVTPELIAHTVRVWQPYYRNRLTADDALAMIMNVAGFRDTL